MAKRGRPPINPRSYRVVKNLVNVFDNSTAKVMQAFTKKQAEEFAEAVRDALEQQTFKHKPLSEAYLEHKVRTGLDPRILIATGAYKEAIGVFKEVIRGRTVWRIGVPEDKIHAPSGLPYKIIARIHEFGSRKRNIPARPHWRPAYSNLIRSMPGKVRTIKKKLVREINKQKSKIR